jgi:hypothetical protein
MPHPDILADQSLFTDINAAAGPLKEFDFQKFKDQ